MGPRVHAKFQRRSAQPLPRYSRRNICDIPSGSTHHVPQGTDVIQHCSHSRQKGWGYPPKKTACQSGLRFQRYNSQKRHHGRPATNTQIFSVISVETRFALRARKLRRRRRRRRRCHAKKRVLRRRRLTWERDFFKTPGSCGSTGRIKFWARCERRGTRGTCERAPFV